MLDKYFVPYDRALNLYELRFNEPCFGFWQYKNGNIKHITTEEGGYYNRLHEPTSEFFWISSPLFCQVFDWFRENFGYFSSPTQSTALGKGVTYDWLITKDLDNGKVFVALVGNKASYEEAELACLDKLIEITEDLK